MRWPPFLLAVLAGLLAPIRITSRLYLADQLARSGVDLKRWPESCLQELADHSVEITKTRSKFWRQSWRAEVVEDLELQALLIRTALGFVEAPEGLYPNDIAEILLSYGIPVPDQKRGKS